MHHSNHLNEAAAYFPCFLSCNEAEGDGASEWCCQCAKCCFVFLALSAFVPQKLLVPSPFRKDEYLISNHLYPQPKTDSFFIPDSAAGLVPEDSDNRF